MARFVGLSISLVSCFLTFAGAEEFLGANRISTEEVEQQLHMELRSLLGRGDSGSSARLDRLQSDLRPMFSALPKAADGGLEPGAVRFALHRFFVLKHGWYVRGLEATGAERWNDGESTAAFEDHIPSYVLQTFEQRHSGRAGLPELAVLAATLEDLVHSETIQVLSTAYNAQDFAVSDGLDLAAEEKILETYLLFHIMPNPKYALLDALRLNLLLKQAPKFYTGWLDTLTFVQDLRDAREYEQQDLQNPFVGGAARLHSFSSIVALIEAVGEKFGQFQNLECHQMKNALLDLSDGSGRVHLSKFYEAAFENRSSHFSESPEYLRHLGVLDETDPRQPKVILTNYMYGRGNCLACSSLYSICCINECESLLAQLERNIASPVATPTRVADLIATMRSDTVSAPRNLSVLMRSRLDDIASRHGGSIPIHGRLFAQWMHHAFPNECPFPHTSGSLEAPVTPAQWLRAEKESGRKLKASKQEMQSFIEAAASSNASEPLSPFQEGVALPWTDVEELMVGQPVARPRAFAWFRVIALSLAVTSAAAGLVNLLRAPVSHFMAGKARMPALIGSREEGRYLV